MVILIVNRDFDLVHGEETDYICSFCCSSFPEVLPYVCFILRQNMLQLFNCFFFLPFITKPVIFVLRSTAVIPTYRKSC